jgi:Cu-Zn family superoxide dismutase
MGFVKLITSVSRGLADGTILRARATLSGAAGGHYDPSPFGMSNPDANHPFHMGDIPNLRADDKGVALFKHVTSRVTIAPGPLSLFDTNGSSMIVHLNEDQGTTGVTGGSGGPRIACGVIEQIP